METLGELFEPGVEVAAEVVGLCMAHLDLHRVIEESDEFIHAYTKDGNILAKGSHVSGRR